MKAYHEDLRKKVVAYTEGGGSKKKAAEVFGICEQTVYRYIALSLTGDLSPKKLERGWKKIDPEKLRQHVEKHSDATLAERAAKFGCSHQAIWLALGLLGITIKKK